MSEARGVSERPLFPPTELEDRRLRPRFHPELREQGRDVVLHRLLGKTELFADLPIRHPVGDVSQHLSFAQSQ